MKLTNTACESAKPKEKPYKMADGQGMYLEIKPNSSKYWRLSYRMLGKQKLLAIGVYSLTRNEGQASKELQFNRR